MDVKDITGVIPAKLPIISAPTIPKIIPIIPPIKDKITDSIKNCISIILVVAPTAFLIPISLVLSVTDTSIMFITPIPPTIVI